jgi:hypothetical protein
VKINSDAFFYHGIGMKLIVRPVVLAGILAVFSLTAQAQPTLGRIFMTAADTDPADNGCHPGPPVTSYPVTADSAFIYFEVLNANAGDTIRIDWLDPTGRDDSFSINPQLLTAGGYCFSGNLPIAGQTPSLRPGTWTVKIQDNATSLGSITFQITSSTCVYYYGGNTIISVPAAGVSGTLLLITQDGCGWTATPSDPTFITITSGASGTGSGTIAYTIAGNTTGAARSGTIVAGGQQALFLQDAGCGYSIDQTGATIAATGGSGTFNLTTATGCPWTAVASDPFITITAGASGTDSEPVSYSVAANTTPSSRTGTITVGGQTFTIQQAAASCGYTINPTGVNAPNSGGTSLVTVTTLAGCPWSATANNSFITINSGATGTGNGTVGYSVAANDTTSQRTGTMTVAGQTFTVTQAASACSYTLNPIGVTPSAAGGPGSFTVTTLVGCPWTATPSDPFITINSGASGSGSGTVNYTVAANTATSGRTATVAVADQTFTVTQAAAPCSYTVSPLNATAVSAGGSGSLTVVAAGGCGWTAVANDSFITITGGASGTGNGSVSYSVAANNTFSSRSGTMTVAGQTVTITQAPAGTTCTYTISPSSVNATAGGGAGSLTVTTADGCLWTAVSNSAFITVSSGASGSGSGTVNYLVAGNNTINPQTGSITVAGQTITFTQAAASCTYSVLPANPTVLATGGTALFTVTTLDGCPWTAISNNSFITINSGASGTGSGTVNYTVAANSTPNIRTGTLTIAGSTITLQEAAGSCSYDVAPPNASAGSGGGPGTLNVTTATGCTWTAVANDAFITVTAGASGSGSGAVNYSVAANDSANVKTGTLTVAGHAVTITEAPGACGYSLTPPGASPASSGGAGSITVNTLNGCGWSASSNVSFIAIVGGNTGVGGGTVNYIVAPNNAVTTRTGTLTVAGQTFTVSQGAASCTWSIDQTSAEIPSTGGGGTIALSTPTGCPWTASSNVPWLTIVSGASGNTSATVNFKAQPNTGAARTGILTIGGQTFTATQDNGCGFLLNPASINAGSDVSMQSITVQTDAACTWTVTDTVSWIQIQGAGSATGPGTVNLTIFANRNAASRSGSITIGTTTLPVTQAGGAPCIFTIGDGVQSAQIPAAGGTGTIDVSVANSTCTWTATSNNTFITVTGGGSGTGNGVVAYSVQANTGAARTGTLTIAGQTYTINEALKPTVTGCTSASNLILNCGAEDGAATADCSSTSSIPSWIADGKAAVCAYGTTGAYSFPTTSGPGPSGRGKNFFAGGNGNAASQLTQNIDVSGFGMQIDTGAFPYLLSGWLGGYENQNDNAVLQIAFETSTGFTLGTASIGPVLPADRNGATGLVQRSATGAVPSGTRKIVAMLQFTRTDGTYNDGYADNLSLQLGDPACSFTLSAPSASLPQGGGTGSFTLTASGSACSWSTSSSALWLHITSAASGSGGAAVNYSVDANPGAARTATIAVGGQVFTVYQGTTAISPGTPFLVDAKSNLYAAGQPTAFSGLLPPVYTFPAGPGQVATFADIIGTVGCGGASTAGADGVGCLSTNINSYQGISGVIDRNAAMFLAGVFLDNNQPGGAAPESLDFTNSNFTGVNPKIGQVFFIGDGLTGTGYGSQQQFYVPPTATRLFLGFADAAGFQGNPGSYDNNVGSLRVSLAVGISGGVPCSYSLNPNSINAPAAGGAESVTVTTQPGCFWSSSVTGSWLTVTPNASNNGQGTLQFSVAANSGTSARTATILIADQTLTINQAAGQAVAAQAVTTGGPGDSCPVTLEPASQAAQPGGGMGQATVVAGNACKWQANSNNPDFITITGSNTGTGTGVVHYLVAPNTGSSSRIGSVTVGNATFPIVQGSGAGVGCTLTLDPVSQTVIPGGGSGHVAVTAASGCTWQATSNTNWIAISPASGSGSGVVGFTVPVNLDANPQDGVISIGQQSATLHRQAGAAAPCSYAFIPTSQAAIAAGAQGSATVTAPAGCTWTAATDSAWISIQPGNHGGNGTVRYSVAPNTSSSLRTGTIVAGGQRFTIEQAGAGGANPCSYALSTASDSAMAAGGPSQVQVTAPAGCLWQVESNSSDWIAVIGGGTGSGNGTIAYAVQPNGTGGARTGSLTIGGQTLTITQPSGGGSCPYTLNPVSAAAIPTAGGTSGVAVMAPAGCAWSVSSSAEWIVITSGGSGWGNSTIAYSVTLNTSGSARTGSLTIAGQTFTISQN